MPSFKIFCSQIIYSFILLFIPFQTIQLLESGADINVTDETVITDKFSGGFKSSFQSDLVVCSNVIL